MTLDESAPDFRSNVAELQVQSFRIEIGPDLPSLWLDPIRIRQVFFNLLSNATRFTDAGSISVRAEREDDMVLFSP